MYSEPTQVSIFAWAASTLTSLQVLRLDQFRQRSSTVPQLNVIYNDIIRRHPVMLARLVSLTAEAHLDDALLLPCSKLTYLKTRVRPGAKNVFDAIGKGSLPSLREFHMTFTPSIWYAHPLQYIGSIIGMRLAEFPQLPHLVVSLSYSRLRFDSVRQATLDATLQAAFLVPAKHIKLNPASLTNIIAMVWDPKDRDREYDFWLGHLDPAGSDVHKCLKTFLLEKNDFEAFRWLRPRLKLLDPIATIPQRAMGAMLASAIPNLVEMNGYLDLLRESLEYSFFRAVRSMAKHVPDKMHHLLVLLCAEPHADWLRSFATKPEGNMYYGVPLWFLLGYDSFQCGRKNLDGMQRLLRSDVGLDPSVRGSITLGGPRIDLLDDLLFTESPSKNRLAMIIPVLTWFKAQGGDKWQDARSRAQNAILAMETGEASLDLVSDIQLLSSIVAVLDWQLASADARRLQQRAVRAAARVFLDGATGNEWRAFASKVEQIFTSFPSEEPLPTTPEAGRVFFGSDSLANEHIVGVARRLSGQDVGCIAF